jgi:hypothetical protein
MLVTIIHYLYVCFGLHLIALIHVVYLGNLIMERYRHRVHPPVGSHRSRLLVV